VLDFRPSEGVLITITVSESTVGQIVRTREGLLCFSQLIDFANLTNEMKLLGDGCQAEVYSKQWAFQVGDGDTDGGEEE